MYEVRADFAKNCLFITLKGYMDNAEAKAAADKVIQESQKLKPGFFVINDISEFSPTTQDGAEHIKRAQAFATKSGAKKFIRIVGKAVTSMQFQRTQREAKVECEVIMVKSMEEALTYLT